MPFNLTLTFSGIAAFIPTTDYDYPMGVVMPGLDREKEALDDEELCPHDSYIKPNPKIKDLDKKTPIRLNGKVLTLDLDFCKKPGYPVPKLPDKLINLGDILADLCDVDPDLLADESPPRPELVMTQIFLPPGAEYDQKYDNRIWSVDALGKGKPIRDYIAHTVSVTYSDLEHASARLEALDGTVAAARRLNLTPSNETDLVVVDLVNTCKELPEVPEYPQPRRDRDFKWYYELLTPCAKQRILDALGSDDLPIPRLEYEATRERAEAAGLKVNMFLVLVHDCFPGQMSNYAKPQVVLNRSRRAGA